MDALGKWLTNKNVLASVVAVLMIATGAILAPGQTSSASAAPTIAKADLEWHDGLNHFILTPVTASATLVGGEEGAASSKAFADVVRTWRGVSSVKEMNGGLVSVATSLTGKQLSSHEEVKQVDDDQLMQLGNIANGNPNDPEFGSQWMLDNTGNSNQVGGTMTGVLGADTKAPKAWAKATGQGVIVADIDSGVDISHPDLSRQIWHNSNEVCGNGIDDDHNGYIDDCDGWDFGSSDNSPLPDVGGSFGSHGTHVAGIIGAHTDNTTGVAGMAPNSRIMALKIASGPNLSTSAMLPAIMYAVDNGAKVINASWGTPPGGTSRASASFLEQGIQYARAHGVLVVVAAGNDGVDIDQSQSWPASFSLYYDNVLTVGASTNADTRASFSNFGVNTVGIFAPGWYIDSTLPGGTYGMMSGTSMASPCTAGAAALVAEAMPSSTPAQWIARLKASVDVAPALAGLSQSSRLNAATSVGAASDPMSVDFKGFQRLIPGTPFVGTATTHFADPTMVHAGDQVRATLITPDAGYLYAVSGAQIAGGVGTVGSAATTDNNGNAVVLTSLSAANISDAAATGLDLKLGIILPDGDYGLMLQVTDASGTPRMNGSAVYFNLDFANSTTTTSTTALGTNIPVTTTTTTILNGSMTTTTQRPITTTTSAHNVTTTTLPSGGSGSNGTTPPTTVRATTTTRTGGGSSATTTTTARPVNTTSAAPPTNVGATTTTAASNGGGGAQTTTTTTRSAGGGSSSNGGGSSSPGVPVTSPPTTLPGSTVTPPPVSNGTWSITSRYPASGNDVGGTMAMINGVFPDVAHATVTLDGQNASIFYATPNTIWFITPAHAAGLVDITVHAPGLTLAMPNAFTYLSTSNSGGSGGSGGSGNGGSSNGGSNSGGNAGNGGSTGTASTLAPGGTTATTIAPNRHRAYLTLVRLPSSNAWGQFSATAWPARTCAAATCNGVAFRQ